MADVGNGDCFNGEIRGSGVEMKGLAQRTGEGGGIGRELGCLSLLLKQWRFQDSQYTGSDYRGERAGSFDAHTNNGVWKSVFFFRYIRMGHPRQGRMLYNMRNSDVNPVFFLFTSCNIFELVETHLESNLESG